MEEQVPESEGSSSDDGDDRESDDGDNDRDEDDPAGSDVSEEALDGMESLRKMKKDIEDSFFAMQVCSFSKLTVG